MFRHRMTIALALITSLTVISGCTLYRIRPATTGATGFTGAVEGIPFYTRSAVCKQESVWEQPALRVSVKLDSITYDTTLGTPKDTLTLIQDEALVERSADVLTRLSNLSHLAITAANRADFIKGFNNLPRADLGAAPDMSKLVLVSNTVSPSTFVDYSHPLYFNVNRAWLGTTSATAKLNDDGTLSEGTAEVEDKTLDTVLDLFPINTLLTDAFGLAKSDDTQGGFLMVYIRTVQIKSLNIRHTATSIHRDMAQPCQAASPIALKPGHPDYLYSRTIAEQSGASDAKPAQNSNALKISGEITLPEKKP